MEKANDKIQHGRAARIVVDRAVDAQDCSRLLAMLGLEAATGERGDGGMSRS